MVGRTLDWRDELGRWLKPFLDRLGHKARRRMCPLYVSGLIGPGDRKSIQPMAERVLLATMTNCTTSLRPGSGMRPRWRRSYLFKRIGSSAATMPCW